MEDSSSDPPLSSMDVQAGSWYRGSQGVRVQALAEEARLKAERTMARTAQELKVQAEQCISNAYMARRDDITRRDVMRAVLRKRASDTKGCMTLPASILFFGLYALSVRLHEDTTHVFLLESAVRAAVERGLAEVETIAETWEWLRGAFADLLFVQKDVYNETLPTSDWSRVLMYSQVQGSVVLEQARDSESAGRTWGAPLVSPNNYTAELERQEAGFISVASVGRRRLEATAAEKDNVPSSGIYTMVRRLGFMRPEMMGVLPGLSDESSTYTFSLYPDMDFMEIQQRLAYLQERQWLDEGTKSLRIKALLLNAELGRPRLEQLTVLLSFSRGGGVYYRIRLESVFLEIWDSFISVGVDFVWVTMLAGNTIYALFVLSQVALAGPKTKTVQRSLSDFVSPAMLLEWLIMLWGWSHVIGFLYVNIPLLGDVRDALRKWMSLGDQDAAAALHVSTQDLLTVFSNYWWLAAWYNLVLMFRFFLAFRAQPRLAVVTKTLKATAVDLLHFLCVFLPTFIAYVISGNLLFGRRMEEFSTIQASWGTCFRIVIESEFEWEELSKEHYWTTAIWVWTFLILSVFLMINMVLAIILDIYNQVRQRVDSNDSIWLDLTTMLKRCWNFREWIKDADLDRLLAEMDGSTSITKAELQEMLPDITNTQADMLFGFCKNHMSFQLKQEMSRAALMKVSASIKISVDKVNEVLQQQVQDMELTAARARLSQQAAHAEGQAKPRENDPQDAGQEDRSPCFSSADAEEKVTDDQFSSPSSLFGDRDAEAREPGEETRPHRLAGTSQPFPGMPRVAGGYCPPLLAPEEVPAEWATKRHDPSRPQWLRVVDQVTDSQDTWVTAIHSKVQEMQWNWHATQLDAAAAHDPAGFSEDDIGTVHSSAGVPIL